MAYTRRTTRSRRTTGRRSSPQRKRVWAREQFVASISGGVLPEPHNCLQEFNTIYHGTGGAVHPPGITVAGMWIAGQLEVEGEPEPGQPQGAVVLGIGVFSENAADHVQVPTAHRFDDWMVYQPFVVPRGVRTDNYVIDLNGTRALQVKSSRRMDELGEKLWCSWGQSALGDSIVHARLWVSTLLLMP